MSRTKKYWNDPKRRTKDCWSLYYGKYIREHAGSSLHKLPYDCVHKCKKNKQISHQIERAMEKELVRDELESEYYDNVED